MNAVKGGKSYMECIHNEVNPYHVVSFPRSFANLKRINAYFSLRELVDFRYDTNAMLLWNVISVCGQ